MGTPIELDELSVLKRALSELRELRSQLEEGEQRRHEPIAIIGLDCRFPGGVDSPERFWQLLREGRNAVGPIPASRWRSDDYFSPDPAAAGKIYTRGGGFIDGIDRFDADFFEISRREATSMDPQQRILLEVTWHALERAGQASLFRSNARVGVFIGAGNNDYGRRFGAPERIDAHFMSGNAMCGLAGRLSYSLGFQGPSLVVDTACSSSLVAVHLACQSLRSGECDLAIAGGVNLILSPLPMIALSATRMLAPDARCKTFDARADGFARAEGCGVVVLRRLSEAVTARDPVAAVLRGSAVNQDGRSSGFTVPSGPAQCALLREALAGAGLQPAAVHYVEAHGTGTSLGDPIEVRALGAVFGEQRPSHRPLLLGSVKTNIGHAEAAAGIAGLIKVVLCLQNGAIPPHLNLESVNPEISLASIPAQIPTQETPWPAGGSSRIAGVSAFGASGTNAHVLVEEAPPAVPATGAVRDWDLLVLSARNDLALRELAESYVAFLRSTSAAFRDICSTSRNGRAHLSSRWAIVAPTAEDAHAKLAAFCGGQGSIAPAPDLPPKWGFLFYPDTQDSPASFAELCLALPRLAELRERRGGSAVRALAELFSLGGLACWAAGSLPGAEPVAAAFLGDPSQAPLLPAAPADAARSALLAQGCDLVLDLDPRMGWASLLDQVSRGFLRGAPLDWRAFDDGTAARKVVLPTYPFRRQRYWLDQAEPEGAPGGQTWRDWLYRVEWRPLPQANASHLMLPSEIATLVQPRVAHYEDVYQLGQSREILAQLDALCIDYISGAWRTMGAFAESGELTPEELMARTGIGSQHTRLVRRMLHVLAEDGFAQEGKGRWEIRPPSAPSGMGERLQALARKYPAYEAVTSLLQRCGEQLPGLLRGEVDPLQLLFSGGGSTAVEIYEQVPVAHALNALVKEAVAAALSTLPPGRPLRILEIGAGSGATTALVLPLFDSACTEYYFTDISPSFLHRAEPKFAQYPFVWFQTYDLDHDPVAQGLRPGQFDLVLAANVVHAARDLRTSLQHIQRLLVPGGLIVFLEETEPQRWVDLTFGLTESWWRFTDTALRRDHPLLSRDRWLRLLSEAGFTGCSTLPEGSAPMGDCIILLARGPASGSSTKAPAGRWLVLADRGGVGAELSRLLLAQGQECTLVPPPPPLPGSGPVVPLDWEKLVVGVTRGVVHLWSLDDPLDEGMELSELQEIQDRDTAALLGLVRAAANSAAEQKPRFWVASRRTACVTSDPRPPDAAHAPLGGCAAVARLEHPELDCRRIDLDTDDAAPALLAEILRDDGEDWVAIRGGIRHAPRLTRVRPKTGGPRVRLAADATFLITGGLTGLGLLSAQWMAAHGARHLALMGRHAPSSAATLAALADLRRDGVAVEVVAGDIAQRADLARALQHIRQRMPPLRGVLNSAMVLEDAPLMQISAPQLRRVLAPKVLGSWNLHQLTRQDPLDFFVLYSAIISVFGNRGQAAYAGANCFLDSLAHYRRALGLPAVSINWGAWGEIGRAVTAGEAVKRVTSRRGIELMPPAEALKALEFAIGSPEPQLAVFAADWHRFIQEIPLDQEPPLLADFSGLRRKAPTSAGESATPFLTCLEMAPVGERRDLLFRHVRDIIAAVLGADRSEPVDAHRPLQEMGVDSLMAVEIRNALGAAIEQTLPATLLFDYPTLHGLVDHLGGRLSIAGDERLAPSPPEEPEVSGAAGVLGRIEALSEAEVDRLLAGKLAHDHARAD